MLRAMSQDATEQVPAQDPSMEVPFSARMPGELRDYLADRARANDRSMGAELRQILKTARAEDARQTAAAA